MAIEVEADEVKPVELNQMKLVSLEVDPFQHSLVEENLVMVGLMEVDPFGINPVEVNLVVVDLVRLGLGMLVDNPVAAEEAHAEQEVLSGLLEEVLTTAGGRIVVSLLIAAWYPGCLWYSLCQVASKTPPTKGKSGQRLPR